MAKNIKRMLAMVLVLCMTLSALPMQALAAEGEGTPEPTITVDAEIITNTDTTSGPEVVVTFTPTSNENVTEVAVSGTNESGATVALTGTVETSTTSTDSSSSASAEVSLAGTETVNEGQPDQIIKDVTHEEITTNTVTANPDGSITNQTINEGTETKEWTEEDTGDGEQPDVTANIELQTGGTGSGVVETTETVTNADGSVTTTTTTDRTVTTETVKIETTVNDTNTDLIEKQPIIADYDKTESDLTVIIVDPSTLSTQGNTPDNGEFQLVGKAATSNLYTTKVLVFYEKDEQGNPVFDENGDPVIEKITHGNDPETIFLDPETNEPAKSLDILYKQYSKKADKNVFATPGTKTSQYILMNESGEYVYTYCVDLQTPTAAAGSKDAWYSVANLEDGTYYTSEESEEHIRSIVTNGYWGTSDEPDTEGNYKDGSLAKIKESLKKAIESGEIEDIIEISYYPNENGTNTGDTLVTEKVSLTSVLDGLTEGEALKATQEAIWAYANGSAISKSGQDGVAVGSVIYGSVGRGSTAGVDSAARCKALYNWLINLETNEASTVVINEDSFIEDMNITVHEKVTEVDGETVEENFDNDTSNDVYNTDLNFKLAFIPGPNDDLLVQVTYTDFDGKNQTVVRRLAGDKEDHAKVDYDEATGSYVLKGLILSENEDFNFDLRLEGTQYLENGVYIYSPVGGRDVSQTMVGIAEGTHDVDVSLGVTIKFDVDENNHVVAERKWHYESDPGTTPPDGNEPTPAVFRREDRGEAVPAPQAQVFRLNNQDNLEEIPEEPVPLATPVVTGDNSGLWIAVVLMSVLCMVAINVFDKKKQHEAF